MHIFRFLPFALASLLPASLPAQAVTITFAGDLNGTPIALDSIVVQNLAAGGDTLLLYPDTVLVLDFSTGIRDYMSDTDPIRSMPNPFHGGAEIEVASTGGELLLMVHDATGREVAAQRVEAAPGRHRFRYTSGIPGLHVVSVLQNGHYHAHRMVALEGTDDQGGTLNYLGASAPSAPAGIIRSDRSLFTWQQGDVLRYIGYASNDTALFSGVMEEVPFTSVMRTFTFHAAACPDAPIMTDVDGNVYATVQVGGQCWITANLRTTHYRDGSTIPNVTGNASWSQMNTGARCSYQNNAALDATYGQLYNWFAVADPRGICPLGWHVPTHVELTQLTDHLGGASVAGGSMKAITLWNEPNNGATNASGLSAVATGVRSNVDGVFGYHGQHGNWWTATEYSANDAWYRHLSYLNAGISGTSVRKRSGYCVRCVKD